jgi:hypothetical protein
MPCSPSQYGHCHTADVLPSTISPGADLASPHLLRFSQMATARATISLACAMRPSSIRAFTSSWKIAKAWSSMNRTSHSAFSDRSSPASPAGARRGAHGSGQVGHRLRGPLQKERPWRGHVGHTAMQPRTGIARQRNTPCSWLPSGRWLSSCTLVPATAWPSHTAVLVPHSEQCPAHPVHCSSPLTHLSAHGAGEVGLSSLVRLHNVCLAPVTRLVALEHRVALLSTCGCQGRQRGQAELLPL